MRAVLVAVAALVIGCDAGVPPEKPTPAPKPTPIPAEPPEPYFIDWQIGGLGSWKDKVVGGILWHVTIDLEKKTLAVTDPGGVTKARALSTDAVQTYARLAKAVREEPHRKPSHSCTDRSETLQIDTLVLADSCPLADPGAAALTAALGRELK